MPLLSVHKHLRVVLLKNARHVDELNRIAEMSASLLESCILNDLDNRFDDRRVGPFSPLDDGRARKLDRIPKKVKCLADGLAICRGSTHTKTLVVSERRHIDAPPV